MKFSLGKLLQLPGCYSIAEQLKQQTKHFEVETGRKLTREEIQELLNLLNKYQKRRNQKAIIKILLCFLFLFAFFGFMFYLVILSFQRM